jgi:tetratricopeptide (TPR) repeat protein
MNMKKMILSLLMLVFSSTLFAQITFDQHKYKYDLLVKGFGLAGTGVETVLKNWEKADSTNADMLQGKFAYYFTKAQTGTVEPRPGKKYLGMDPLLSLKDTLGADVYYYQDVVYDDELFGKAIHAADRAISLYPDKLDYRFMKANAYISYEKESPDLTLAYLMDLIDENGKRSKPWHFEGEKSDDAFFQEAMQEYCYSFYLIGSSQSYEAFFKLSEKMNSLYPANLSFINNMGSYYLVAKEDPKTALKYYKKVTKKDSKDQIALQNSVVAARKLGNVKLEAKYRKIYDEAK